MIAASREAALTATQSTRFVSTCVHVPQRAWRLLSGLLSNSWHLLECMNVSIPVGLFANIDERSNSLFNGMIPTMTRSRAP